MQLQLEREPEAREIMQHTIFANNFEPVVMPGKRQLTRGTCVVYIRENGVISTISSMGVITTPFYIAFTLSIRR